MKSRKFFPDDTLVRICRDIQRMDKSQTEWSLAESSDMFQEGSYSGGFDSDEREFCFEVHLGSQEYWFQFSLATALRIADGEHVELEMTPADG